MNDLWLTIKAWFKGIIFVAILLYASVFIYKNNGETVKFWYWSQSTETSVFMLASSAFIAGIIFAIIVRTTWKTWRQISEIRGRSRTGKLEREMADMKAKAAMLQTRPANAEVSSGQVERVKPPASSDY
jgi:uncharacterized membrane protein YciS (DUF1049 family)